MSVPAVQVIRNGMVEGIHYASAVVVDADGAILWSIGDTSSHILPRSANKLMQGLAMVRNGLPLKDKLLALACASHSGEQIHIDGVHAILNGANLSVDSLLCPPDWPLDSVQRDTLIAQGLEPSRIYMNCSGKHAAMLFTCVLNGWDTNTYLDRAHPLQVACQQSLEDLTNEKVQHIATDGCGAPLMSTSLVGLARSFSAFAGPSARGNELKIADAIRANPEYLSGTRRDDRDLMASVPGMVAKIGAEAVYGIGLGDGRALALKISDGADRARIVLAATILRDVLGVVSEVVDQQSSLPLLGGGEKVGEVRAVISR
jgi:L-asparaginase II